MGNYINSALFDDEEVIYEGAYALWDNFWWIFFSLGLLLPVIFYWQRFSEIAVTNYRVISKKGIIRRHVSEYPIKKIETINISQTIVGRIFNYGHITITGTGNNILCIRNVKDPDTFKKYISYLCMKQS